MCSHRFLCGNTQNVTTLTQRLKLVQDQSNTVQLYFEKQQQKYKCTETNKTDGN